jgi:cystathionine gamma-synthase
MQDEPKQNWSPRTLVAQALGRIDEETGAVVPPIHLASTFIRDPDNQYSRGYLYGRPDNATVREAEAIIAALEGAPVAMVLGSGMSAATAVFLALAPGDHVVAPIVMYWGLRVWLLNEATHWGLKVDLVDTSDLDAVRAAVKPDVTKLAILHMPPARSLPLIPPARRRC